MTRITHRACHVQPMCGIVRSYICTSREPSCVVASFVCRRPSLFIAAMPKTMKQMKAIFKKYLQKRVRLQRAASIIVAAHQAAIVVQQQAAIAAHQAALDHHFVLQAQHDQLLQQAVDAHENGDTDDEWLIAHEYENEEWEDGV